MDTEDRKRARTLALTMEATYKDDAKGLASAQKSAARVVKSMRLYYPNETDDTLAVAATAVCYIMSNLMQMSMAHAVDSMETMLSAYPLAAGVLAGVYILPDQEDEPAREGAKPKLGDTLKNTGQYL